MNCQSEYARICSLGRHSSNWLHLRMRCVMLVTVGSLVTALIGCQTASYSAASLPQSMRVSSVPADTGINLEQIGGSGTGTSQIGPGDLVEITIISGNGEERVTPMPARVAQDGSVTVPLIGVVQVDGLEPMAAEARIAAAAVERGIFRQPYVTLKVTEPAVNRVTVMGAVAKPGVIELPRGSCDLASALAAAGGLAEDASTHVEILHRNSPSFLAKQLQQSPGDASDGVQLAAYTSPANPPGAPFGPPGPLPIAGRLDAPSTVGPSAEPEMTRIDLAQAEPVSVKSRKLNDQDVVMVRADVERVIHVSGLVRRPDQFELTRNKDIRLLDAIAMAGGTTSPLADKVYVIRQMPDMPEPAVIKASIAGAKRRGNENLLLAAGDMVSVEDTPQTMMLDTATKFFRMAFGVSGSWTAF
jgi:polysaccharide export outer membrane protein